MQNAKELHTYSHCTSYCTANSYDLLGLASFFKKKGYYTRISKDFLHVAGIKKPGDIFFFNYGCFVAWGFTKHFEEKLVEYVKEFSGQSLKAGIEIDHFYFHYNDKTSIDTHEKLRVDIISLGSDDAMLKFAFSYGLAQSIKLEAFEESLKEVIKKNLNLPEEIASRGTISLSRRAIFKRMGEIFMARSSVNINIEYLDTPEFFWRNPSLEPFYISTIKFMDIESRVSALNQKLDVLQHLLDILNTQVQHRHSSMLEIVIILLIAVEIVISLFEFHLV